MVEYNNTNRVGLKSGVQNSAPTSDVNKLIAGLRNDYRNAVADGDVANIELLESTIQELESQREMPQVSYAKFVQAKSLTQQYLDDEDFSEGRGSFNVVGPSLDIEIAEISGPFKTFEEFTSFQLTSLAGLDKLLASKSK